MKFQNFCHTALLASGLVMATASLQPAFAEEFSFSLNGLGIQESADGDRTFSGSLSVDGEQMPERKTIEFDLTHGDRDDGQSFEVGLRDQGESILNAVFDLFGLTASNEKRAPFDAQVSGDINPTDSEIDVSLGEDMPGLRIKIQTPQGSGE